MRFLCVKINTGNFAGCIELNADSDAQEKTKIVRNDVVRKLRKLDPRKHLNGIPKFQNLDKCSKLPLLFVFNLSFSLKM